MLFLEIDGCSEAIFRRAIDEGYMPNMARWLHTGSHRIVGWETDLSCQTGAAQAGILHGNNHNIPAFRWVEKANNNRVISSNGPKDSPLIEQRISDGNGLLARAGAARANLFSGNAQDDLMVYSTLTSLSQFYRPSYYVFFANPYNFLRTMTLVVGEVLRELWECRRQIRHGVWPRIPEKRRGVYPWVRAIATILLRDMSVYTLVDDIFQGKADAIYATFYAYDEVAHHSGVEDRDAFAVLHELDKAFARIERATHEAERFYHVAVLADHGQSKGATFKQRYGITLKDLVVSLLPGGDQDAPGTGHARGLGPRRRAGDRGGTRPGRQQGHEPGRRAGDAQAHAGRRGAGGARVPAGARRAGRAGRWRRRTPS